MTKLLTKLPEDLRDTMRAMNLPAPKFDFTGFFTVTFRKGPPQSVLVPGQVTGQVPIQVPIQVTIQVAGHVEIAVRRRMRRIGPVFGFPGFLWRGNSNLALGSGSTGSPPTGEFND